MVAVTWSGRRPRCAGLVSVLLLLISAVWVAAARDLLLQAGVSRTYTCGGTIGTFRFYVQRPYDLKDDSNNISPDILTYSSCNAITMSVYNNAKPFESGSTTKPRAEMRVTDHDYKSGVHTAAFDLTVKSAVDKTNVFQVFRDDSSDPSPTLQLRIVGGDLLGAGFKNGNINQYIKLASNVVNNKVTVLVSHDINNNIVKVTVNSKSPVSFSVDGKGKTHYFKIGVYSSADSKTSDLLRATYANIKIA